MININIKGILIDADFLLNYTNHNLSGEEAMFLLQISYLTNQGKIPFSIELVKEHLRMTEKEIFTMLDVLINKRCIALSSNSKVSFYVFNDKEKYYTLR